MITVLLQSFVIYAKKPCPRSDYQMFFTSRYGAVPNNVESSTNNVLHLIALSAYEDKSLEDALISTYWKIVELLGPEEMKALLNHKNYAEFNPLEWTLFLNTYGLTMAKVNTPEVYLIAEEHHSTSVERWYDVTKYEMDRCGGPVRHLCYGLIFLHERSMEDDMTKKALLSEFLQTYINQKFKLNLPFCLLWILIKLHVIVLTYFYTVCGRWAFSDTTDRNVTEVKCIAWFLRDEIISNFWMKFSPQAE